MKTSLFQYWYKRLMETLRYEGIYILLWRIAKMCFSPLGALGMETIYWKDLTQPLEEFRTKVDTTICRANESDMEQLAALLGRRYGPRTHMSEKYRDIFLKRFRDGNECFVAKIGTEIVGYNWIIYDQKVQLAEGYRIIHLKDDEVYTHDAYTSEVWRGKGIHTAGLNQMLLFLQQSGYQRVYTYANTDNKSSLKTHHRLGWELLGSILYFKPRGAKKAWIRQLNGTLEPIVGNQMPSVPEA